MRPFVNYDKGQLNHLVLPSHIEVRFTQRHCKQCVVLPHRCAFVLQKIPSTRQESLAPMSSPSCLPACVLLQEFSFWVPCVKGIWWTELAAVSSILFLGFIHSVACGTLSTQVLFALEWYSLARGHSRLCTHHHSHTVGWFPFWTVCTVLAGVLW